MGLLRRRLGTWVCCGALVAGIGAPLMGQAVPRPTARAAAPATRAAAAAGAATRPSANPLLPPPIAAESFFIDIALVPKGPPTGPAGFEPLASAADWQAYREMFGAAADDLPRQRVSGQLAVARKMIDAAAGPEPAALSPGLRRLLLMRAAAIAYRSAEGYPVADKAVGAYVARMDKHSAAQVGALWSIANQIARLSVTPKAERLRYDAIAARANMQLTLLLLEIDQLDAAQAVFKQVGYHEGWLKNDRATRGQIAQVRTEVRQAVAMMEYLAAQHRSAVRNDVGALTAFYLYGRYVKGQVSLVADLPRVPGSSLDQLARDLDAAGRGDVGAAFTAAEGLRVAARGIPDARIRARALYAALQNYDAFMASPLTERDRINRTLARIAREGVVTDGARKAGAIDPFAPPPAASGGAPALAMGER